MRPPLGGRAREGAPHYDNLCDVCGRQVPPIRFNSTTCDEICQRASKRKRTRMEQFWIDYAAGTVTDLTA